MNNQDDFQFDLPVACFKPRSDGCSQEIARSLELKREAASSAEMKMDRLFREGEIAAEQNWTTGSDESCPYLDQTACKWWMCGYISQSRLMKAIALQSKLEERES